MHTIEHILANYKEDKEVKARGRLRAMRRHGKIIFADLYDQTGKIQLYIKIAHLSDKELLIKDLNIGDIISIGGRLFKTRTGEMTIALDDIERLAQIYRPLPEKWHGLKDRELRYRQRYLDLIANPEVSRLFYQRSKIVSEIRRYLEKKGYMEVETPMLHPIAGGARGRPFKTHLNVYNQELYLRIAPELYLKRLLVGGFEKIFEINRSFRNEGISRRHNPEFTMLEVYTAYSSYKDVMRLLEDMFVYLLERLGKEKRLVYQDREIDFSPPWPEVSFVQALGVDGDDLDTDVLRKRLEERLGTSLEQMSRSQILHLSEEMIDLQDINRPVFFTDYPVEMCPLAKVKPDNPKLTERFELFIAGIEVANAYSEVNEPKEQRNRFLAQAKEDKLIDEDFIRSLEYAMPPAAGLGVGIDRLVMLLCNQPSIRDVILFPLLKEDDRLVQKEME